MAINTLLRECQYSCSPDAECTKPSRCTDDACRNFAYTLVKEHADCGSDDTKIGNFSDAKACLRGRVRGVGRRARPEMRGLRLRT